MTILSTILLLTSGFLAAGLAAALRLLRAARDEVAHLETLMDDR